MNADRLIYLTKVATIIKCLFFLFQYDSELNADGKGSDLDDKPDPFSTRLHVKFV